MTVESAYELTSVVRACNASDGTYAATINPQANNVGESE